MGWDLGFGYWIMGLMDLVFGVNFEGCFELDDFYESFLVLKFYDFIVLEEFIDLDVYFLGKFGMCLLLFLWVLDMVLF